MAQVTSGRVNSGTLKHSYFYVNWQQASQSTSENKTIINWQVGLNTGGATSNYDYWYTNAVRVNSVYINGENVCSGTYSNIGLSGGKDYQLASGSATIYHNTDGAKTFNISISGWLYTYGDTSGSSNFELVNIPRYASITTFTVSKRDETSVKVTWGASAECDAIWYSKDNGSSWVNTSGYPDFNITGLSAGTTYNFKIRVRRKDSQLTTDSGTYTQTTYYYPHCTDSPNFTIGNNVTMKISNPLSRNISVTIIGANGLTKTTENFSGTSISGFSNTDWQNFWYSTIPNSKNGKYQVKVNYGSIAMTRNNGNTCSIKGTETPTVGTITYRDNNTTVTAITGNDQLIVQNQSNLLIQYTGASAKNSASISKCSLWLNGILKTSTGVNGKIDFGKVNSANNLTLTMIVTDSRGLTSTYTKTITMLELKDPTAIVTLKRLNNYEDETYLTVDGSVSSVNSKNTMTIQYRYKVSGGTYGSFTTIGDNVKQTLSLDKNNSYIFNIVITDAFGLKYDREHALGKGVFPFFIDTVLNALGMNALPRAEKMFEIDGRVVESEKEFSIPTTIGAKTGWYLAMSGDFTYTTNKAFLIAIQQTMSGGAGLLYLNMRYNENSLTVQRFEWLAQNGISSSNVKLKIEGNSFYLYFKTTSNYQQYYIKVIQEKILGGWNFRQYTMHTPTLEDTVEEPSGRTPTDFIETVSNSNGTAIKYPDGTMIVTQKFRRTIYKTQWKTWGALHTVPFASMPNFPVYFVGENPTVSITIEAPGYNCFMGTLSDNGLGTSNKERAGEFQLIRPTAVSEDTPIDVHIVAYGRWK